MAKHEFGILQTDPKPGQRFDHYEPERYRCISVDDDFIEPLLFQLDSIDFYWHSLDTPGKGLAYTGITLIPPSSLDSVIALLCHEELEELKRLLMYAKDQNKFVIHFGI